MTVTNSTVVAYINKEGGIHSVEMCALLWKNNDLVPSLPDNLKSEAHFRVPECDGRPTVLLEPSPINIMVTASVGVQTVFLLLMLILTQLSFTG